MPYKNEIKQRQYQKEWMREYRKRKREETRALLLQFEQRKNRPFVELQKVDKKRRETKLSPETLIEETLEKTTYFAYTYFVVALMGAEEHLDWNFERRAEFIRDFVNEVVKCTPGDQMCQLKVVKKSAQKLFSLVAKSPKLTQDLRFRQLNAIQNLDSMMERLDRAVKLRIKKTEQ